MKTFIDKQKQYLLSGVSFAIPFIACGGILIALSLGIAQMTGHVDKFNAPDPSQVPVLNFLFTLGVQAFNLLLPILAGYISYAIAGKPGLVAGFVGGAIAALPQEFGDKPNLALIISDFVQNAFAAIPQDAVDKPAFVADYVHKAISELPPVNTAKAGFLGAILAGILAGNTVNFIKKIPIHKLLRPIMPILIIPVLSTIVVGGIMFIINMPIACIMIKLESWLQNMQNSSAILLAMTLGAMIAFDMGGPVNKAAFFFGASMIEQGNYVVMGAIAAAICTPPLGLGLATLLQKKLWTEEQRESGIAALGMGMIGITEGAIPFAAADPIKIIPCIILGSMAASVTAMLGSVGNHAPHGGPIVLLVIDNRIMYIVAIIVGALVTAISVNLVKKLTLKTES